MDTQDLSGIFNRRRHHLDRTYVRSAQYKDGRGKTVDPACHHSWGGSTGNDSFSFISRKEKNPQCV